MQWRYQYISPGASPRTPRLAHVLTCYAMLRLLLQNRVLVLRVKVRAHRARAPRNVPNSQRLTGSLGAKLTLGLLLYVNVITYASFAEAMANTPASRYSPPPPPMAPPPLVGR